MYKIITNNYNDEIKLTKEIIGKDEGYFKRSYILFNDDTYSLLFATTTRNKISNTVPTKDKTKDPSKISYYDISNKRNADVTNESLANFDFNEDVFTFYSSDWGVESSFDDFVRTNASNNFSSSSGTSLSRRSPSPPMHGAEFPKNIQPMRCTTCLKKFFSTEEAEKHFIETEHIDFENIDT